MGEFLSLGEAAKISGYHRDYLSFLIRKGELKAQRIGRNWFLSQSELKLFLKKKHNHSDWQAANQKLFGWKKLFLLTASVVTIFCLIFYKNQTKQSDLVSTNQVKSYEVKTYYSDTASDVSMAPSTANLVNIKP